MTTNKEQELSDFESTDGNPPAQDSELTADNAGEARVAAEELQARLAKAEQTAEENWSRAVRAQAEMENLKKRAQKDVEDAHKFALTGFAKELLPVLDSLVLGLQAAAGESEEVEKFRVGTELTLKQLQAAFAKFNIVEIDPIGQPFNADQHQAMVMQETEGAAPNTVVNVFQKGYMLNGRLLRPAMVVVAKASNKAPAGTPKIDEQA